MHNTVWVDTGNQNMREHASINRWSNCLSGPVAPTATAAGPHRQYHRPRKARSHGPQASEYSHESNEGHVEPGTAWLLAGAAALMLISIIITILTLQDRARLNRVYQPLVWALLAGAALTLLVAVWQPVAWLFLLIMTLIQSAIWFFAVYRWLTCYPDESGLESDQTAAVDDIA